MCYCLSVIRCPCVEPGLHLQGPGGCSCPAEVLRLQRGSRRCWALPGHVPVPHPPVVRIPSPGRQLAQWAPRLPSAWTLHPLLSFLTPCGGAQEFPLALGKELLYSQDWDAPGDPRLWAGINLSTLPLWGETLP